MKGINPDWGPNAISVWRKRVIFRAWHRGTREADLLLGGFADATVPDLDAAGLESFEALLDCGDPEIYDWMTGRADPPYELDASLMRQLKEFRLPRASS